MPQPPQSVSIRIAIDVPVGVAASVQAEEKAPYHPKKPKLGVTSSSPDADTSVSVTAQGTIPARVTFSDTALEVQAVVQSPGAPINPSPMGATAGTSVDNLTWNWAALPGVSSSPDPGTANKLVVWWKKPQAPGGPPPDWQVQAFTFYGTAPGGSGSSFEALAAFASKGLTFPTFWCVEISGFSDQNAAFNNLHALRADRSVANPVWRNHGDGERSPRLELTWSPADRTWTLTAQLGTACFQATGHSPSMFGPLEFTVGQAGHEARAGLPRIVAHPV